MSDPVTKSAAEAIFNVMLQAQRDVGDVALCEALDLLAGDTGQNTFRHMASILRGVAAPGRKAIDDQAALRHIAAFPPVQRREAVGIVAQRVAGANATRKRVDAIARRLRRKLKNETDEMVLSASSVS